MKKGYFITGTDTDVGKTWATIALMRFFKRNGLSVLGMKPVAAGCEWVDGQLKNEDALLIQENCSLIIDYQQLNPYAFETAVSPHLAAKKEVVDVEVIMSSFKEIKQKADVVLVEGAGGWLVPVNHEYDIADLAKEMKLPVIMVVAIKLGCINHARLTYKAIIDSGCHCAGWLAVCVDSEMTMQKGNIETLENKIAAPLLGVLPYVQERDFNFLASHINAKELI